MDKNKSAGVTLLFIAIFSLAAWYIYLTVANPACITWQDNLNYLLSDKNELKSWFHASIFSSATSLICAITYFSKASKAKNILLLLLIFCMAQAAVAAWFLSWDLKVIYSLPVISAYLAYINPNKAFKRGSAQTPRP